MEELRRILLSMGIDEQDIRTEHTLRTHLSLDSTETVELEVRIQELCGLKVNLWDTHDFTVGELAEHIRLARTGG